MINIIYYDRYDLKITKSEPSKKTPTSLTLHDFVVITCQMIGMFLILMGTFQNYPTFTAINAEITYTTYYMQYLIFPRR